MRLGVVSDTHGSLVAWQRTLDVVGKVDVILHAGDVLYHGPRNPLPEGYDAGGLGEAMNGYGGRLLIAKGNCDADIDELVLGVPLLSPYALVAAEGRYIMIHHGHLIAPDDMPALMRRYRLDLLVTGHTHVPRLTRVHGARPGIILNPGSPALPKTEDRRGTVAVIEESGVRVLHVDDGSEMTSCSW